MAVVIKIDIKHKCSVCGQPKTDDELNGYDPFTSDYSKAYCRVLTECNSEHAQEIISDLLTALNR